MGMEWWKASSCYAVAENLQLYTTELGHSTNVVTPDEERLSTQRNNRSFSAARQRRLWTGLHFGVRGHYENRVPEHHPAYTRNAHTNVHPILFIFVRFNPILCSCPVYYDILLRETLLDSTRKSKILPCAKLTMRDFELPPRSR